MKLKEWIIKDKMQKLAFWIMFNIFYIFAGSYLVTAEIISYFIFSIVYVPLLVTNIGISIVICRKGYYQKNVIHIFMVLILIFGIISTIFAVDVKTSIIGFSNRYEGLLSIMYYFSLMFLSSFLNKKYKKTIILFIVLTGIIQCFYGFLQIKQFPGIHRKYNEFQMNYNEDFTKATVTFQKWATGFTINPNFFGTYMLICLSCSIGIFFDEKKIKNSIVYLVISGFLFFGLLISNTSSCVVGFAFVNIYILVYNIKNKYYNKVIALLMVSVCIFSITVFTDNTTLLNDLKIIGNESKEIASGNFNETYGTNRLFIWRETLKIVPKNLLHGVGIDNYFYAFDGTHLSRRSGKIVFDKAHNEYLQILVTEGIFCLISYLIVYFLICIKGIKNSFKRNEVVFILPILGYLIQAFFNISVIEVAPVFFIILGMNIDYENKK